ncbi:MAG: flagellar basal-body rod protein FlgF [Proteobacteria bacterium]|nr:flagellar basal-body rod protein FlgF [Pseudomonadota bacterium]
MENAGYIALSRQLALRREMSLVAHNIANMNTPAFKAEKMFFREYIKEPAKGEALSFVQDICMARDLSAGPVSTTGNDLDLAISGQAYFSIETPEGVRYTRHGRFQLDGQGRIVDGLGAPVLSTAGAPITVPPGSGSLTISDDGTVSGNAATIGRIGLYEFDKESELKREGNGSFSAEGQQPQDANKSRIVQGALEQSNVQAIIEMTRMIEIHRSYESTAKLIKDQHDQFMRSVGKLTSMRQN